MASYRGAQIFEAIGLNTDLVNTYFCGTAGRVEGAGINEVAEESLRRHRKGLSAPAYRGRRSGFGPRRHVSVAQGRGGHLFNPQTIHLLQEAVRSARLRSLQAVCETGQ
ncbi:MAG: hypothetical protein R3F07_13500 [Opitutaceae bacterium]